MRRVRRWIAAAVVMTLFAGCATSSDVGGDAFTVGDAVWTGLYFAALVLGVVGAKILVESHQD